MEFKVGDRISLLLPDHGKVFGKITAIELFTDSVKVLWDDGGWSWWTDQWLTKEMDNSGHT